MQAGSNSQITNCKKGSSGGTGKTFVSDSLRICSAMVENIIQHTVN